MNLLDLFIGVSQATKIRRIRRWLSRNTFSNCSFLTIKRCYERYSKSRVTTAVLREALAAEGYAVSSGRVVYQLTPEGQHGRIPRAVRSLRQKHP